MANIKKILKRTAWILLSLFLVIATAIILFITFIDIFGNGDDEFQSEAPKTKAEKDSAIMAAATVTQDTIVQIVRVSNKSDLNYGIDTEAGNVQRIFDGRRINISIVGVDSRMGTRYKHADANHVISILIDQGLIEITSIPRDTPCDAEQEDTTQNKLTVLYPALGKERYLETVAEIAELDRIHYYIELGFSQARGILELLGFKDSGSALQILRSRTAIGGNDFQRVYTQAQFIRQMLLKHHDKFTGFFSEVLIRGGLSLVNTNMTYPIIENIFEQLESKGFPKSSDDISIRIRPPLKIKYKIYDFSDENTINQLTDMVNEHSGHSSTITGVVGDEVAVKLGGILDKSALDSLSNPQKVITSLKTLFYQRAWLQVNNPNERDSIRNRFKLMLMDAYIKRKRPDKAKEVEKIIDAEKKLFQTPVFNN